MLNCGHSLCKNCLILLLPQQCQQEADNLILNKNEKNLQNNSLSIEI